MSMILLLAIIALIYWRIKPKRKQPILLFSRRKHFSLLAIFMALLLVLTIIAEVMEVKIQPSASVKALTDDVDFNIMEAIINNEDIDPLFINEKRTHSIEDILTIHNSQSSYYIYIERKDENDGLIEETLYRSAFTVDDYDFSTKMPVTKPVWTGNTMTTPEKKVTKITFSTYYDSNFLAQLTKQEYKSSSGFGYGLTYPSVHLLVPKDLIIHITDDNNIIYVDEF